MFILSNFSSQKPRYQIEQGLALEWLTQAHASAQATIENLSPTEREVFAARMGKLVQRCACGPDKIATRGHVSADLGCLDFENNALYDVVRHPRGRGTAARAQLYSEVVNRYFVEEYQDERVAPSELIHVTCTGYVAPSGAQRLVAEKGWGATTQVSHAYHMGCYAAFPAIRLAVGHLSSPAAFVPEGTSRRADIVHTELCTLHLDPSDHSAEQCVVQSLFADGFVRYSLGRVEQPASCFELLALSERVLPDSAESMSWSAGDFGMHMSLARNVPELIAADLETFVSRLVEKAGFTLRDVLAHAVLAVHPGGPKIIEGVQSTLKLSDTQVQASKDVLREHGNLSSATLPHVWLRILADPVVRPGTIVVSLAFGPGLTVCGGVFRKW